MLIKDIMKKNIYTASKDNTLGECAQIMAENKVGSVVIVERGKAINILTESDVIRAVWRFNSLDMPVKDVLDKIKKGKSLITVTQNVTYYQCFQLLHKYNIKHLVVVDERGELKGIVSYADFIEFLNDFSVKDHLTDVYNKRFLEFSLEKFKAEKTKFSVIFIDLDNFKEVNDNYGHRTGDILLKEVGAFFKKNVRKTDIVARFGGDEFIILAVNTPEDGAFKLAQKLLEGLGRRKWQVLGHTFQIRFSAGVASTFGKIHEEDSIWTVVELADKALYQAKASGRGKVCVYDKTMAGERQWSLR